MSIIYRTGTLKDSYDVFQICFRSIMDYSERMNVMAITGGNDPDVLDSMWQRRKSMFEFLTEQASQFWVAEKDGEVIAYARSLEHDGFQELTEFFVLPDQQSVGVGVNYYCASSLLPGRSIERLLLPGI